MRWTVFALIGLATAGLAGGPMAAGFWAVSLTVAIVGLLWAIGHWRSLTWPASVGLFVFAVGGGYGVLQDLSLFWLVVSLVLALLAWDLGGYQLQMESIAEIRQAPRLHRTHLIRLTIALVIGLLLSWFASGLTVELGYVWAIGLGLIGIYGLSRGVRFLRRESD